MTAAVDVSVMVPARNAADTIEAAVASLPGLDADVSIEVLLVDDASTDDTRLVVERLGDPRVRLLDGPGRGVNAARNVALDAMRGEWLTLLDADDEWLPDRLPVLLDEARRLRVRLIADDMLIEHENAEPDSLLRMRGLSLSATSMISPAQFAAHDLGWSKPLVHRDVIGGMRFPEHIRKTGDFPFWFRAVHRANGLWVDPRPGYFHRRHQNSLSANAADLWMQLVMATADLLSDPTLHLSGAERAALETRLSTGVARYYRLRAQSDWRDGSLLSAATQYLAHPSTLRERWHAVKHRLSRPPRS